MPALHGERLTSLRRLRQLSQGAMAERVGVTQPFLSLVERSQRPFPEQLATVTAQRFGVPLSFFAVSPPLVDAAPVTFRKKASAGVRDEARVVQAFCEASRVFAQVSARSGYKSSELIEAERAAADPAEVADAVRAQLGIGPSAPVPNVTRALERLGVGVLDRLHPEPTPTGDHVSLSRPADASGRPVVAMVAPRPGAVQRLSLAHEVGHLLFDGARTAAIAGTRRVEERRAYAFAAAFLIPDHVLRAKVSETLTLHGYLPIKAEYGISVGALVMRARDLGVISRDRARSLQIQLASHGWRTDEPVEVPIERAQLFEQAYRRVFGDRTVRQVAELTGSDPSLLATWLGGQPEATASKNADVISLADRRGWSVAKAGA